MKVWIHKIWRYQRKNTAMELWILVLLVVPPSFALGSIMPPKKPTCDTPDFINANRQIKIVCRVEHSYSQIDLVFDFYYESVEPNTTILGTQSYNRLIYSTTCTFTIDTSDLIVGKEYQFGVTVYPNVTNGKNYSSESDPTPPISYLPIEITRFTANGENQTLIVEEGSNVSFVCDAVGAPAFRLELDQYLTLASSTTELLRHTETNIQCRDSHKYTCEARNGETTTKSVDVFVRCPLHLSSLSDNNMVFKTNSKEATITVDVYGYPAPNSYSLQLEEKSAMQTIDRNQYSVYHKNVSVGEYSVTLKLLNVNPEESPKFVLTIDNGLGVLNYSFSVTTPPPTTTTTSKYPDGNYYYSRTESYSFNIWIALGPAIAVVVLIVGGVTACKVCRKRRADQSQRANQQGVENPGMTVVNHTSASPNQNSPPYNYDPKMTSYYS